MKIKLDNYKREEIITRVINVAILPLIATKYSYHMCRAKFLQDNNSKAQCDYAKRWFKRNFLTKKLWRL